ncbi:FAD-dependent oxidoreductase, partial [Candidatus Bathyarchaeota archaeon]|nr:FAD-dependent oxidoreductase [Candidatus Bathyarchaeota archaeon]
NFRVGGVDVERMPPRDEINKLFEEAKAKGELSIPRENILYFPKTRKSEIHFNTTRIVMVDGTKADDLTYAETEGRRQMVELIKFLKEKVPGFENAYLLTSAFQVGVRETRRIIGEYILTEEDIVKARKFKDTIAKGSYPIDIHNPKGEGTVIKRPPPGESYDIPYRCIVPKKVDNLLVAGRCVSSTHEAQAAIRVIPIVVAIGQAAGTAAALAVRLNIPPRELDVSLLQETLEKQGAVLR